MVVGVFGIKLSLLPPGIEIVTGVAEFLGGAFGGFPITCSGNNSLDSFRSRFLGTHDDFHRPADQRLEFRQVQGFGIQLLANTNNGHWQTLLLFYSTPSRPHR